MEVDVWQLGCLFFTCSQLKYPFGSQRNTHNMIERIMRRDCAVEDIVDRDWRTMVNRCLALSAQDRPTAEGLVRHIASIWHP
jgi:serine/threonine protein kinase